MLRRLLAGVLVLSFGTVSPARAADHVAIDAQFVGLDALTAFSPTDAFLRQTFKALGPRILQIPAEVGEGEAEEAAVIAAFWESMRGAKSVRLVFNDDDPAHPRVRFLMEATPVEPEKAADMARAVAFIAEKEGLTLVDDGPLRKFKTDTGDEIAFGIRSGMFALRINGLDSVDAPVGTVAGAPAGAPLLLRLHLNGPTISKLLAMIPQDDPEDAAKGFAALKALGLYGEESMSLDVGIWNVGNGLEGSAAFRRLHSVSFPGVDPPPTLGDAFLSLIPADVTAVQASVFDLSAFDRVLTAADLPGRTEMSEESRKNLGFDIWGDFLAHLGPRYAWYQSERTGGGGVMSTVALAELKNPDAFAASHAKLVEKINGFAAGMARGYIRIDAVDVGGHPSFMLHTPGLPLPVAPMWTISGNTIIAGATPIAFGEALAIAAKKGPSIASLPALRDRIGDKAGGLAALGYCDTPRLARGSIGTGTTLLTLLANATRTSPSATNPGIPGPAAYLTGVRPCVGVATWWGNDLVCRWTMDESITVLGAVAANQYGNIWSIQSMAFLTGVTMPAIHRARENAIEIREQQMEHREPAPEQGAQERTPEQMIREATEMRDRLRAERAEKQMQLISLAIVSHAAKNGDAFPGALQVLVDEGNMQSGVLTSPYGPREGGDYVMSIPAETGAQISRPDATVIVVDAAAIATPGAPITIGMADSSVRQVTLEELGVLLDQPQNAGMKGALGAN